VIINGNLNLPLLVRILFAEDLLAVLFVPQVHVPIADADRLARQTDQPLDVVRLWLLGKLEDKYIPSVRIAELIGIFVDENAVTVEGERVFNIIEGEPTVGADDAFDTSIRQQKALFMMHLVTGADD